MYYVSMKPGLFKTFGTPYDSFWCCTGSGVEEYAKLGDTLYFHDDAGINVNQFVASEVEWPEKGVRLRQETEFPEEAKTLLTVQAEKPVRLAVRVRKPYWCAAPMVRVNGRAEVAVVKANGYLEVDRTWQNGDRVEVDLPMKFHAEPLPGNHEAQAMMYGPLVLAGKMGRDGLTEEMQYGPTGPAHSGHFTDATMPVIDEARNGAWVEKADEPLRFKTAGQRTAMELEPLYRVMDERYTIYWKVNRG
jgi:DUF1680 family protein